jgi:hypothetical protein
VRVMKANEGRRKVKPTNIQEGTHHDRKSI